jgi:hypothetical protein
MKMNQTLKMGIFVLIVIGSFLVFPEIGKAWCTPSSRSRDVSGYCTGETAVNECRSELACACPSGSGPCGCSVQFNINYDDVGCLATGPNGCHALGECCTWVKQSKFPDAESYNSNECIVKSSCGLGCCDNGSGVWDASEKKCVQCNGKLENKVCGSAGTVSTDACNAGLTYCISPGCAVEGNKKCESACDPSVSPECDDKDPGMNVSVPGGVCNNCVFTPLCGNGQLDSGEQCDPPQDAACPGQCQNCQCPAPPHGNCPTGPTYTCPAAMKCPTCPEELIGGLVPCGRSCDDPCTAECECAPCTLCHLFVLFKRIIDFLAKDVLFPLAVLMIVVGGVMFLTAAGDPGRIGTAKKILTSVVIGLVIIFLAWLIVDTIIMFITPAGSPFQNWSTINCPICGDGTCDPGENSENCPDDCVAAPPPGVCSDTDGGLNKLVKGTCTDAIGTHTDSCLDPSNIEEWYCEAINDTCQPLPGSCPSTAPHCVEGVCVGPPGACVDTDDGSKLVKGTCTDALGSHIDDCKDATTLREWNCDGDVCKLEEVTCPPVLPNCVDGACVAGT